VQYIIKLGTEGLNSVVNLRANCQLSHEDDMMALSSGENEHLK